MKHTLAFAVSLLLASTSLACDCGEGAKSAYLKKVTSRESTTITSRDGTPLRTNFWGTEEKDETPLAKAPVSPLQPAKSEARSGVSSDIQTVR